MGFIHTKLSPFLKEFFDVDHLKKKYSLKYCFCFMFWVFGCEACGNFAPQPGIESLPLVLEDEVVTTEPPRKSCFLLLTYGEVM